MSTSIRFPDLPEGAGLGVKSLFLTILVSLVDLRIVSVVETVGIVEIVETSTRRGVNR
jgi:hypothetical protein